MRRYVTVWVCPDDKCGNYYGAQSIEKEDLSKNFNVTNSGDDGFRQTHNRSRCPGCGGQRVRRRAFITGSNEGG